MMSAEETRVKESLSKHYLPDELLSEILSRLPVKSLIRFLCVSKSWRSMIEDPNFCRLHLNKFANNRHEHHLLVAQQKGCNGKEKYIVRNSGSFKPTVTLDSLDSAGLGEKRYVVCSIDGLVMLKYATETVELVLWNPSIRKVRPLPPAPDVKEMHSIDFGFGFSSSLNDYKLVRLVGQGEGDLHSVAIYTVGTGLWKTIEFQGKGISDWCWFFDFGIWKTVCFKGHLYFIATHRHTEDEDLVSFDLVNEVFASTNAPVAYNRDGDWELMLRDVTLIGGYYLGLVYLLPNEGCIWLQERNETDFESMQWVKFFIFITPIPWFTGLDVTDDAPTFLYLGRNGDVVLQWDSKRVTSYNLKTGKEKRLVLKKRRLDMHLVCGYIESLVLLNG